MVYGIELVIFLAYDAEQMQEPTPLKKKKKKKEEDYLSLHNHTSRNYLKF